MDESKIPLTETPPTEQEKLSSLVYLNQSNKSFHLLDKIISFSPEQEEAYHHVTPLIIIGPAGSGKTALTLEKMKRARGQILYVTLSPYLADNSRNIYFAHHYENDDQDISFLSFKEFLETMRVPEGEEITYRAFSGWLQRFPRQQRVSDAHRLYEEFRGVITGPVTDKPWLDRGDYLNRGVRQSIYLDKDRELVYRLFEKYLVFLKDNGYYDPNILAHGYLKHAQQTYDFIVVDEVQDITNIQLQLILKTLKSTDQFILCGDSNQIVHPNFFSWSNLKSMLYNAESLESHKVTRILQSNFRNSTAVTDLANRLLRIKQKRFGSIDRESNYLMKSVSKKPGELALIKDEDKAKRELNQKIRRSTKFAVLVMRDEEKAAARRFFDTPLLFSIQEIKGLEYENVILVNFISSDRANFEEITKGVNPEDLTGDMEYIRARDKTDKSLEAYKFFVNSLYVAVTRAVQRLYFIESNTGHPLVGMLEIQDIGDSVTIDVKQSSIEEWQAEARKLELQGRQEQADEIRRDILRTQPVPWDVYTPERVHSLISRACDKKEISQKPKKALFEYGLYYNEPRLIELLSAHGFDRAKQVCIVRHARMPFDRSAYDRQSANLMTRYQQRYTGKFFKDILRECELYGVDHRSVFNKTPLMLAATAGNPALIKELLEASADTELTDNYCQTAWQLALQRAMKDSKFASELFPGVHELLAPSSVSLKIEERLIKIDNRLGEFLLFQVFFATLRGRINRHYLELVPFTAVELAEIMAYLPDSVIPEYRKRRSYISSLLSKNEVDSANPYCRKLFRRNRTGHYILSPKLSIRVKDRWLDVYSHIRSDRIPPIGTENDKYFLRRLQSLIAEEKKDLF